MEFTKAAKFSLFFICVLFISFFTIGTVLILCPDIFLILMSVSFVSVISVILYLDIVKI